MTCYRTYVIVSIILCRRRTMPGWWISYEQKRNSLFCELCQHMASKVCTTKIFLAVFVERLRTNVKLYELADA